MLLNVSRKGGNAVSAEGFVEGLRDEQMALTSFISLLRIEQDALVRGDASGVAELEADKAAQIEALARLADQRSSHLTSQGLNGNADGMKIWMDRHPELAPAARKIWSELMALAEAARQLNDGNGVLIESKLQQNRQKLAVLQAAGSSDGVYRSDGRLSPLRSAKSFSQA